MSLNEQMIGDDYVISTNYSCINFKFNKYDCPKFNFDEKSKIINYSLSPSMQFCIYFKNGSWIYYL